MKFIFFSTITGGIYYLYSIHAAHREANIVCEGDGRKTRGIIGWFLLTILTAGLYSLFIWPCGVINRWADYLRKNNQRPRVTGGQFFLWLVFGSLLGGIGPFIAYYKLLHIWNDANELYNKGAKNEVKSDSASIDNKVVVGDKLGATAPSASVSMATMTNQQQYSHPTTLALNDKRKFWAWLLLTFVTSGISNLVMVHTISKDVEVTCNNSGYSRKKFGNSLIWLTVLFSIILSLLFIIGYSYYTEFIWYALSSLSYYIGIDLSVTVVRYIIQYAYVVILVTSYLIGLVISIQTLLLIERQAAFLKKHGRDPIISAPMYVLFWALSLITVGIVGFVALYKQIKQWNAANELYNSLEEERKSGKPIEVVPVNVEADKVVATHQRIEVYPTQQDSLKRTEPVYRNPNTEI